VTVPAVVVSFVVALVVVGVSVVVSAPESIIKYLIIPMLFVTVVLIGQKQSLQRIYT
jgi:hypothetical protein